MQDRGRAGRGTAEDRTPGISPVRAFFLLGAVAAIVPLTVLATRPEAAPTTPPSPREPDYSLTDEEAIARFSELHSVFRRASRNRDQSALKLMLVSDSPLVKTATEQIEQLIRDGVLDRSRFGRSRVSVIENTGDQISLEQVVTIRPRFVSEARGRRVSGRHPITQRVRWILRLESGTWKVFDSVVLSSRRAK